MPRARVIHLPFYGFVGIYRERTTSTAGSTDGPGQLVAVVTASPKINAACEMARRRRRLPLAASRYLVLRNLSRTTERYFPNLKSSTHELFDSRRCRP